LLNSMPESQRIFWFCSLALVFALASFLTIHAWHTGVTIDEAASYLMYVNEPWGDSWIAFANTNTLNNHVLNSFVIKLVDLVYPWHEFAMRVPNLLAFLVYAMAVCFIVINLSSLVSRLIALLVFFSNPFALEYFSLARGYGLGLAFEAAALFFALKLCTGIKEQKQDCFALFFAGFLFSIQLSI